MFMKGITRSTYDAKDGKFQSTIIYDSIIIGYDTAQQFLFDQIMKIMATQRIKSAFAIIMPSRI